MKTSQGENKFFHTIRPTAIQLSHKSLSLNDLCSSQNLSHFEIPRETPVSRFPVKTYNRLNPILVLSDPVTLCHCLAEIPTYNNSTNNTENPVGNPVEIGLNLTPNYPQSAQNPAAPFFLFSQTNSGIMSTTMWVLVPSKGLMKNCLFYLVAAWVGVLSASSANIVVCVQPSGVARLQLTDHQCCSACCDSACADCSIPTQETGCFLHHNPCCQDVVFPFPPVTVVTTVFSAPSQSPMVSNLSDSNQYNSKIPYSSPGLILSDPAVNTAILLI